MNIEPHFFHAVITRRWSIDYLGIWVYCLLVTPKVAGRSCCTES